MLARLRSYIPTTILAFLIFYFGFQALTGDRGLLSTNARKESLEQVLAPALPVAKPGPAQAAAVPVAAT